MFQIAVFHGAFFLSRQKKFWTFYHFNKNLRDKFEKNKKVVAYFIFQVNTDEF